MRRIKSHTLQKLEYLRKYIEAYLTATKRLPIKFYIDAFAGTGRCILCDERCNFQGGSRCFKCGKGKLVDGSALIALKIKNVFTKYIFIEYKNRNVNELKGNINKYIHSFKVSRTEIIKADTNRISDLIFKYLPKKSGSLIFLDPEGPELLWESIKGFSKIEKVDLLILYPYDMALVRLTKNYPEKLDKFYGSVKWRSIYRDRKASAEKKKVNLLNLYIEKLKRLGFEYVEYRQIRRRIRDGKALYHLILATHHPTGAKIIKDIFDKELDGQMKMKFK